MLFLKIYRSDLHLRSLNWAKRKPLHSAIVRSIPIDTIQVARYTVTVPPGSSYAGRFSTVYGGDVVILIFCGEFTAIMISQPIRSVS